MPRAQGVLGEAGVNRASPSLTRILSILLPAGCLCFSILLGLPGAVFAPDAAQYRMLALGQRGTVPAPFSARILGPALAGGLGRVTGLGVDNGFLLLGVVCLIALLALMAALLRSWRAPATIFAAIFLTPFWVDTFHDYFLPDLLHASILAAILLCLFHGRAAMAFLLLFPAYLARESTALVAVCLVFACWRRVRLRTAMVGVAAIVAGALVSRHFGQGGPASVHGLSGGLYILGKLIWSLFKNGLGLPLWSNTLPECSPVWVGTIPRGYHLGAIRSIGFCRPDVWGPARLILAWFGIFGIAPAFTAALWGKMRLPGGSCSLSRPSAPAAFSLENRGLATEPGPGFVMAFRFCIVYGMISILVTPLLGASVDRLVEYGWPFYFGVLPWFIFRSYDLSSFRSSAMLLLHLGTCWLAWFSFRQQAGYLFAGLAVLALNGLAYGLLRRSKSGGLPAPRLW
jgi:hypothetical protein